MGSARSATAHRLTSGCGCQARGIPTAARCGPRQTASQCPSDSGFVFISLSKGAYHAHYRETDQGDGHPILALS